MEWENSALGNLFVPDVLTPEQFYDSRRDDSTIRPVKKLMMAILEDALRCFQNNADAKGGPRKRLFNEAEQWLIGEGGEGPFSFETVCETLGIEPQFLRRGLRDWRTQQLAGVSTRRLARRSPVVRSGRISAPARRDAKRTAAAVARLGFLPRGSRRLHFCIIEHGAASLTRCARSLIFLRPETRRGFYPPRVTDLSPHTYHWGAGAGAPPPAGAVGPFAAIAPPGGGT